MNVEESYYQIKRLISEERFEEAEERLADLAGQTEKLEEWACSFINTLVYSILIPQGRFREALAWLDDSIQGDYGYESWNSISNLGQVMIKLGDLDRAEKLFQLLIDANEGPIDEAQEFLEMLESGEAEGLIESAEDPRESRAYIHALGHLKENGLKETVVDLFSSSRGTAVRSFVKGVMGVKGYGALNPTNDQVAQALWDFITEDVFEPVPSYQDSVLAAKLEYANNGHRRVLREAAIQGSGEAAYFLAQAILQERGKGNPQGWLNLANARGFQHGGRQSGRNSPRMF
jgi:tetratricopeptide (TPR) repeat protein